MKKIILQLTVILLLVVALPITFFFIKQVSNLTENEKIVQQAFDQQLETILFTINQNSENYIVSWVNQLDIPVDCQSSLMQDIAAQLFQNNLAIRQIGFYKASDQSELKVINRSDENITSRPDAAIASNLVRLMEQNYRRIESRRVGEFTNLYFVLRSGNSDLLGVIVIHTKTFIDQNLGSGIQQISQGRFNISIIDTIVQSDVNISTADTTTLMNRHWQEMWYLPGNIATIGLQTATIDQLVGERFRRDNYIFLTMVIIILIGVTFVIVTIRREVKLAEMKSEFVSNVSHEIRTPLALISMYTETLLMNRIKTEEKKTEYLQVIHQETTRLGAMVNRILSFSKMEKNKRTFQFSPVDMNEVVTEVAENFKPHFIANEVALTLELTSENATVSADKESITETLINLIDNAIKYGKEKSKKVEIRTKRAQQSFIVEVEDNGIGIARKHQKQVFDKFYRVTQGNLAHKAKGSGLGLNIVQTIMKKHKGKIKLHSQEGEGSCFSLVFPLNNKHNG